MCKAINTISQTYSARELQQDSPASREESVCDEGKRTVGTQGRGGDVPQTPGSVIQCQPLTYPV